MTTGVCRAAVASVLVFFVACSDGDTFLRVLALSARPLTVAQNPHPHVRTEQPELRILIEDGITRSATLATLVAALNASDVIVYIRSAVRMPSGIRWLSGSSALPGCVADARTHVRLVEAGIVILDIVEIDGPECRLRLLQR